MTISLKTFIYTVYQYAALKFLSHFLVCVQVLVKVSDILSSFRGMKKKSVWKIQKHEQTVLAFIKLLFVNVSSMNEIYNTKKNKGQIFIYAKKLQKHFEAVVKIYSNDKEFLP